VKMSGPITQKAILIFGQKWEKLSKELKELLQDN